MPIVGRTDLSWLLACAVRYSLGRVSYAPSYTAEIVVTYLGALNKSERATLAGEIRGHPFMLSKDDDYRDIRATWESLVAKLEEETPDAKP